LQLKSFSGFKAN